MLGWRKWTVPAGRTRSDSRAANPGAAAAPGRLVDVILRSLSQINFRNLITPSVDFCGGVNAIVGPNASGKSNLLEAAYLGCTGELASGKIGEALRIGTDEGFVGVKLERQDGVASIDIGLSPGRRLIRVDGQVVRSYDLARVAAAVLITPGDAELVHGSPSARRHYLDGLLSKLSRRYAMLHREYLRVVEQRNSMLRQAPTDATLGVWTDRLVQLGQEIMALRHRAVKRVAEVAARTYREIAPRGRGLDIVLYGEEAPDLRHALQQSLSEEMARGMTIVGPHRDDLKLTLDGYSIQGYGSRGEARTSALALRVAEYRLLHEKHGEPPVLLLDDYTAELDGDRRDYLLQLAGTTPQALVTGTMPPPAWERRFTVEDGAVNLYAT